MLLPLSRVVKWRLPILWRMPHVVSGRCKMVVNSRSCTVFSFYIWRHRGPVHGALISCGADRALLEDGFGGGAGAFRWENGGGAVTLDSTKFGQDVSADGSVVIGERNGPEAYRWTSATGTMGLGFLPEQNRSSAYAVSGDGSTVVGTGGGNTAMLWTAASGITKIFDGRAWGISADGSVVVGDTGNTAGLPPTEAVYWTETGGFVRIGSLAGTVASSANDASADGSVIVGGTANPRRAFIWDTINGMRDLAVLEDLGLDLTGWALTTAWGISDNGKTIIGSGINPDRETEAWVARLPYDVSGCIALQGDPLVGVMVLLKHKKGKQNNITDADGCYGFDNVDTSKEVDVVIEWPAIP